MAQVANPELVRNLQPYFKGIDDSPIARLSTANVTNPPTEAELIAAFDDPSNLPEGWMGAINDNGADTTFFLVMAIGGKWTYELMSVAV